MEEANLMEVDFHKYCPLCKYGPVDEVKDPCNDCLENCIRVSTRKPEFFKEAE